MTDLPRISIITASYNIAKFIEHTIRSVVSQGYPNLQYIVIDGGSTDGTLDIINRYKKHLDIVVSEKDDGQYHAIQKGLSLATGDVMAWLNADDTYFPWTLATVGRVFSQFPTVDWIMGVNSYLDVQGQLTAMFSSPPSIPREFIKNGWCRENLAGYLQQEGMFWRRQVWKSAGGFDLKYKLAADFKLWTKFAEHTDLVILGVPLASFRRRPDQQRSSKERDAYLREVKQAVANLPRPPFIWEWVAKLGLIPAYVCRLSIWGKSRLIAYDHFTERWKVVVNRRPLSKMSLTELRVMSAMRDR